MRFLGERSAAGLLIRAAEAIPGILLDIDQIKPVINDFMGLEELEFKYARIINNIPVSIPDKSNDSTPASLRRVSIFLISPVPNLIFI